MICKQFFSLVLLTLVTTLAGNAQTPIGIWKTIDDVTDEAKSHVEIYEENGKIYGKISKLLRKAPDTLCEACKGKKKNKPLIGMVVLEGLAPQNDSWSGGTIMDPENGKTYKCKMSMETNDKLKVRGYIGIEALGRNQYWYRVE